MTELLKDDHRALWDGSPAPAGIDTCCPCCGRGEPMRSSDWQPMETAPLNPYGKAYGPVVLIWNRACGNASSAYYEPMHGWRNRDTGPAWVLDDGVGDTAIAPEDAGGWMPLAAPPDETPTPNAIIDTREVFGRFSGGDYHEGLEEGWKAGAAQERRIWEDAVTRSLGTMPSGLAHALDEARAGVEGE